ncbi:LAFA_0F11584g1_1 [Lachancea sp. 'fantastica']|nr:LAFA_0F11584g1_1 [Lachancea sp. 'fantastica']
MEAGTAAFAKNQSAQAQLRNQLLSNDMGNIDFADEEIRAAGPRNSGPPAGFPPNHYNRPQPQQQPYQQVPYQQPQYFAPHEQMQPMQNEQAQTFGNIPFNNRRMPASGYAPQDPRASSLTSQSFAPSGKKSLQSNGISNLFKLRQNRSKEVENDNEEETFITDADNSLLTFNDISSLRNNGGHKYGMGAGMDDTSPIIPTLMTKSHDKMNNVEYRKFLAAQKKMNYSAISKQNKQGAQGFNNDPRAMSLQSSQNPYTPQQQIYGGQMAPYSHANSMTSGTPQMMPYGRTNSMMAGGPPPTAQYGRANSMMSGPPPQARGWSPQPHVQRPINNGQINNGPRAMSLTAAAGRRPMPQAYPSSQPQTRAFQPRTQGTPGPSIKDQNMQTTTLPPGTVGNNYASQNSQRFKAVTSASVETEQDDYDATSTQALRDYETHASSSSALSDKSFPSYRARSQTPDSQAEMKKEMPNIHGGMDSEPQTQQKSTINTGKLNIIKLSTPHQRELLDRGNTMHSSNMDSEIVDQANSNSMDGKNSSMLGRKLEESPKFNSSENRASPQHPGMTYGNRRRSQIQSMATMESAVSTDSPTKKRNQNNLYMLDNATDGNAYVTAPELIERDDGVNEHNLSEITITSRANSSKSISSQGSQFNRAGNKSSERKETGFSKTRNLFRKLSSRGSKGDGLDRNSRHSSAGSLLDRVQTSDSAVSEKDGIPEGKVWSSKSSNPKRKSFHSLFSNSSSGTNAGERVKSYASLANIEEKSPVSDADASRRNSHESQLDTTLNADDIRRGETSMHSSSQPLGSQFMDSSRDQNDDDFNFDNTVSEPYKPIFASQAELDIAPDAHNKHKFKTIFISSDQMSVLTEQTTLMKEIDLLSQELAESVAREARLEQEITGRISDTDAARMSLSFVDFEIELRKKSSKVVELIQQLNDERLRRYIAEEQLLLQENGAKPSTADLVHKIHSLTQALERKDQEIAALSDQLTKQSVS